jgi:hypothetical protein
VTIPNVTLRLKQMTILGVTLIGGHLAAVAAQPKQALKQMTILGVTLIGGHLAAVAAVAAVAAPPTPAQAPTQMISGVTQTGCMTGGLLV